MDIKPIFLSLKRSKFMAIVMLIQIAITMAVLSNAIFIAKETLREWNLPSGIPHEDVVRVTARFYDPNRDLGEAIYTDIERIKQFPGVEAVTASNAVPFTAENVIGVYLEDIEDAQRYQSVVFEADEQIFDVLQIELLEGRQFTSADVIKGSRSQVTEDSSEVMISEDMAKVLFGEESAIDKTVWLSKGADPVKIVGVYSNFMTGERLNGRGKSYQSFIRPQVKWAPRNEPHYLIRMAAGTAESKLEDVLAIIYQEQGRYVFVNERLKRTQKRMYDGRGSRALMFLVISAVLVLITALGITGFTSFQVNQRRKQIGTRRALGAKKSDIIKYFLTENSIVTLMGLTLGTLISLGIAFLIAEQAGQNMYSTSVLLLVAGFIWAINLLAAYFPARQASKVAPAIVTRSA